MRYLIYFYNGDDLEKEELSDSLQEAFDIADNYLDTFDMAEIIDTESGERWVR